MKPEKLECLLDSFIANRSEYDTVDAVVANALNLADERVFVPNCDLYGASDVFHLFERNQTGGGSIASNSQTLAQGVQSTQVAELGRHLADLADQFSTIWQNNSCVRFEKSCIIVPPEEQTISLTIIRSDVSEDTITKVTWKTLDKTALSGTHYIGSSGEVVFDKGEKKKTIKIKILQTSDDTMDLRFNVEVSASDGGFSPKTMTVTLKKLDNFYDDERQVVESLPSSPFTVEDIRSVLDISLNSRTFHVALTHLCSAADSVHLEFALALDLSRLCLPKLQRASVLKVLKDFFRMEDIDR